ncbi:MAG TPA: prepilin-type N-terminal cleavage/methylation domain-containing protein [Candidatus Paceibacterota bacterium]|nr:prepilin-type N-terminal cleavage/methylation domain-containing protein [Candidatus Paceibacterota bacterium]
MNKGFNKGFTLIELLVVIAIIGILAGIVLASLGSARSGASDAKIKEQLSGFKTAMEAYYAKNGNYGPGGTAANGCAAAPSVAPYNDATVGLLGLSDTDNYPSTAALACWDNRATGVAATAWGVQATLSDASTWCVDSTGASKAGGTIASGDVTC